MGNDPVDYETTTSRFGNIGLMIYKDNIDMGLHRSVKDMQWLFLETALKGLRYLERKIGIVMSKDHMYLEK